MNETINILKEHRTIRNFSDQPIAEATIKTIIECGLRGATAGNMQFYSIIKVTDKKILEKLAETCDNQRLIANASFGLVFVADAHKYVKYFKARNVKQHFEDYKDPSFTDFFLALQDAMICAQNTVVAAESLGIGTCYIGDIVEHYEIHKELFQLPEHVMPVSLVVFGNYEKVPKLKERFAFEDVVFENTYKEVDILEMFKERERGNEDFAIRTYNRKWNQPFFTEMERSLRLYLAEFDLKIVNKDE